jgi:hypothetical protein
VIQAAPVIIRLQEVLVFDSLNDRIKRDEDASTTPRQRYVVYAAVLAVSAVLFGGLYAGIRLLE